MSANYNPKHNKYCINCNKYGHLQKFCKCPITSYGVILVRTAEITQQNGTIVAKNGVLKTKSDLIKISNLINNIEFLLVSRRHSLGFIEFIRGRYRINNTNNVIFLLQQMLPQEINILKDKSFDEIWKEFWKDKINRKYVRDEYYISFNKYKDLKQDGWLDQNLETVQLKYPFPEWGFPKGRKNINENDLSCALREFTEETGINTDEINIISQEKTFIEQLIGTDGKHYRHIYFFAEMKTNTNPKIDVNTNSQCEIGDIGFFNYNDAINMLREYHVSKKEVLKNSLIYYINLMLQNSNL